MVPGMGMQGGGFPHHRDDRRGRAARLAGIGRDVDPGPDAYLDGSVEDRLLDGIAEAQSRDWRIRVWLAGISLGCQAILRCVRARPDLAEG